MAIFSAKSIMEPRAVFFCKCRVLYNADNAASKEGILGCPVIRWFFINPRRIGEVNREERMVGGSTADQSRSSGLGAAASGQAWAATPCSVSGLGAGFWCSSCGVPETNHLD